MNEVFFGEIRESFSSEGHHAEVDAFLADCRQLAITGDPSLLQRPRYEVVQATMSVAVQRMLHWAHRHRPDATDPEEIPTQAIVGVMTGVGISAANFGYDPAAVARKGGAVLVTAYRNTLEFEAKPKPKKRGDA
jgi:hypothetical protein